LGLVHLLGLLLLRLRVCVADSSVGVDVVRVVGHVGVGVRVAAFVAVGRVAGVVSGHVCVVVSGGADAVVVVAVGESVLVFIARDLAAVVSRVAI